MTQIRSFSRQRRRSDARLKAKQKRFASTISGRFQEKPLVFEAARVNGATVAIGGHFYPGYIGTDTAKVVNKGRPAAARYEAVDGSANAALSRAQQQIATGGGGGSAIPADVQSLITAAMSQHASKDYIEAHPTDDPNVNRSGIYYSFNFGIVGGLGNDESKNILDALNRIGQAGGGTLILRSRGDGTDPIQLDGLASIYYNNVRLICHSPIALGKLGGLRIMGAYDEIGPREGDLGLALRDTSFTDDDGRTVLPLRTGHGAYLSIGDRIVVRGENDKSGLALYKDEAYVYAVDGDDVTLTEELENTYEDTYPDSDWEPDKTTGSTVYIVRYAAFPDDIPPGTVEIVFPDADVEGFEPGDYVVLRDDRTENDYNPAAIRGNGLPYLNPACYEITRIVSMESNDGNTTVTFAESTRHPFSAAAHGGMSRLLPVTHSSIEAPNVYYYEEQINRKAHPISVTYSAHCRLDRCHVDGSGGQRGHVRISYCYWTTANDVSVTNPKFVDSGDGYGLGIYYSRYCDVINSHFTGCRHSILFQLATQCSAINNFSVDDRISGIDIHGVNSIGILIANNVITRSNRHTGDSTRGAGILVGNTSHCIGDHDVLVVGNLISGYDSPNCSALEFIPASTGVTFQANKISDCYNGARMQLNSKQCTPVQTAINVNIVGNTFSRCSNRCIAITAQPTYDGSNSLGKIEGLLIKGNISEQNARHFEVTGANGATRIRIEDNSIMAPVSSSGRHAIEVTGATGVEIVRNTVTGANRGVRVASCTDARVTHNELDGTTEDVPFTDGGSNTGLEVDLNTPYSGGGGGGGGDLDSSMFTAKGDLLAGTGAGSGAKLSTPGNNYILSSNSSETTGLKWLPLANVGNSSSITVNLTVDDGYLRADLVDTISNSYLANVAEATIKGRAVGSGTGKPVDLTADQALAILQTASGWATAFAGDYVPTTGGTGIGSLTLANDAVLSTDFVRARDTSGLKIQNLASTGWLVRNSDGWLVADATVGLSADVVRTTTLRAIASTSLRIVEQNGGTGWTIEDSTGYLVSDNNVGMKTESVAARDGSGLRLTEQAGKGFSIQNTNGHLIADSGVDVRAEVVRTDHLRALTTAGLRLSDTNNSKGWLIQNTTGYLIADDGVALVADIVQAVDNFLGNQIVSPGALTVTTASASDEILRLRHTQSNGNPYLSFYQASTRRGYIRYQDTNDTLQLVSEYGPVTLAGGSGGSSTQRLSVDPTGARFGGVNARYLVDIGDSAENSAIHGPNTIFFVSRNGFTRASVRNSTNDTEIQVAAGTTDVRIGSITNHPLAFTHNNNVIAQVTGSGLSVTGDLSLTGNIIFSFGATLTAFNLAADNVVGTPVTWPSSVISYQSGYSGYIGFRRFGDQVFIRGATTFSKSSSATYTLSGVLIGTINSSVYRPSAPMVKPGVIVYTPGSQVSPCFVSFADGGDITVYANAAPAGAHAIHVALSPFSTWF